MISVKDAPLVLGMLQRGDRQHDIAAYFGVNPGRIADVKFMRRPEYAGLAPAPLDELPPPGGRAAFNRVDQLINETMNLIDQIRVLDELIATTPPRSPSVILTLSVGLIEHILTTRNQHNRKIRPIKIKRFAAYMLNGEWYLGDTVKFNIDGDLNDGQNRLRAALQADVPLTTHAVFAMDPKSFAILDSGTVRTGSDTFKVAGVLNPEIANRATRWLMIFNDPKMNRGVNIANSDLYEHYQKRINQDALQRAITAAKKVSRAIPTGTLAAMFYLFDRRDASKAKIFAHDLEKEIRGARTLLAKLRRMRRDNNNRLNELTITALTFQTWDAYVNGNGAIEARRLKWTEAEDHPALA